MPANITAKEYKSIRYALISGPDCCINSEKAISKLLEEASQGQLHRLLVHRQFIDESRFDIKSGFLNELAQKIIRHKVKLAVVGQFSLAEALALKAYLYSKRLQHHAQFFNNDQQALEWLAQ